MPKAVSMNDAGNRLGELVGYVGDHHDDVIVVENGEPKAVLIAYGSYNEITALREQQRRMEALQDLRALRQEVRSNNLDLTEEQANDLANRLSHDLIDDLAEDGKATFERDRL